MPDGDRRKSAGTDVTEPEHTLYDASSQFRKPLPHRRPPPDAKRISGVDMTVDMARSIPILALNRRRHDGDRHGFRNDGERL